jgi:hypothetical protein
MNVKPPRVCTSQIRQVISIQRINIVVWQIFLQELGSWELPRELPGVLCQLVSFPDSSRAPDPLQNVWQENRSYLCAGDQDHAGSRGKMSRFWRTIRGRWCGSSYSK